MDKTTIVGIIFMVIILGFGIYSLDRKSYFNAGFALVCLIILGVFVFKNINVYRKPIPKDEVIKKYKELMEEKYSISIFSNCTLYDDTETPESYIIILRDVDEGTGQTRYFPFECNKYELIFGKGTGSITHSVAKALFWLYKNSNIAIGQELYTDLTNRARSQTEAELTRARLEKELESGSQQTQPGVGE